MRFLTTRMNSDMPTGNFALLEMSQNHRSMRSTIQWDLLFVLYCLAKEILNMKGKPLSGLNLVHNRYGIRRWLRPTWSFTTYWRHAHHTCNQGCLWFLTFFAIPSTFVPTIFPTIWPKKPIDRWIWLDMSGVLRKTTKSLQCLQMLASVANKEPQRFLSGAWSMVDERIVELHFTGLWTSWNHCILQNSSCSVPC